MKLYKKILLGAAFVSLTASCTEGFEEMNVNPNQPSTASSAQLLTTAQYNFATNIGDAWNNGRMGMYYSQYWASTYYADESRYQIREGSNNTMWNEFYANVLRELVEAQKIEMEAQVVGYENRIAIAEIMKVMTYHYISDIYGGPIPYKEAINDEIATPVYNTGPEVYAGLLSTLEEQIAKLDPSKPSFAKGDVVYGGNVTMWKKFANSLRMRIALRMIDVNQADAITAIRKSLDPANGGIISSNSESAMFRWVSSPPNNNPLNEAYKTRVDFAVSEPFVEYLQKYDDPRLAVYADPLNNKGTAILDAQGNKQYVGEVYGLDGSSGTSNGDSKIVSLPSDYTIGATAPTIFLDYSEVEFMLAEIAARNLSVGLAGTAAEHYAKGIKASFDFAGLSNAEYTAYLANVPYVATNLETALDAIGSQKWIAMYGQGIQGWLERLRLDFEDPYTNEEIFALPADGSLDPEVDTVPFRMSYPVVEGSLNAENYKKAVSIFGTNSKGAKAWWDVK
ncbi:SusD/RagB family nutrient-binding outer membrane lipoprotein [Pontibacter cellulosilyticus]|uniref:SusD/RagB family nutrient-binding outer membrane lipoprotein n=1 Tax=Pontibacter cellulosilyticus TaxID=1720253 RepID=A0A923NCB4_9BACT|nr:SusD/RagB family nutrient-binding outer membrane lipoprotein [Pontibacter cellulosilyticus]MBC5994787.1 SusD/RagB family nutrient-binding outer membrane lipoprotein [Pontibacter cellulosilyticus]